VGGGTTPPNLRRGAKYQNHQPIKPRACTPLGSIQGIKTS